MPGIKHTEKNSNMPVRAIYYLKLGHFYPITVVYSIFDVEESMTIVMTTSVKRARFSGSRPSQDPVQILEPLF